MFAHVDADAFFASVLVRQNPLLLGKPLLAMGMGGGCVISASYEAKKMGIKTGMRLSDARKLCPGAIAMPSDFAETGKASDDIETHLQSLCPDIEQMSVDEWFLDLDTLVGGVPDDLSSWARNAREMIQRKTAISVSVGAAPTKILAKMASEYRKPGGVTIVTGSEPVPSSALNLWNAQRVTRERGTETLTIEAFLKDRPAAAIPGIGKKRSQRTEIYGWKTSWDVSQAPTELLKRLFGKQGPELQSELLGTSVYDLVTEPAPPKSVSRARSFPPEKDRNVLWAHALRHLEYLVLKMRRHGLACSGISLGLRNGDYSGFSGTERSLPSPCDTESALRDVLEECFTQIYQTGTAYTQVHAALWHLAPKGAEQISLFAEPEQLETEQALQESLDKLHEKFGRNSITRGSAMTVRSGTKKHFEFAAYK